MGSQIEKILNKGAKIKKSKLKTIIWIGWITFALGIIDYSGNKIGAPGSWMKDALHGLFFICMSVFYFALYQNMKQQKLNLEIIERIQLIEEKLPR